MPPLGWLAHDGDCGGEEGAVLHGSFNADHVADLDVGKGDGLAAFAEGGVLVGDEGVGGVVGAALQTDGQVVDGGDFAHEPRLAVVGLHLAHLFGALRIDLEDDDAPMDFAAASISPEAAMASPTLMSVALMALAG